MASMHKVVSQICLLDNHGDCGHPVICLLRFYARCLFNAAEIIRKLTITIFGSKDKRLAADQLLEMLVTSGNKIHNRCKQTNALCK